MHLSGRGERRRSSVHDEEVTSPRTMRRWLAFAQAFGLAVTSLLVAMPARAEPRFRLDAGSTFSRFEQQVKTEVGGARGERLVTESQFGYAQG